MKAVKGWCLIKPMFHETVVNQRDKDHVTLESQIYNVMVLQLYFPNQTGTTLQLSEGCLKSLSKILPAVIITINIDNDR